MAARRSERTRIVADLGWLGGMLQLAFGVSLLAVPEAPLVAGTLAVASGAGMALAGTLVHFRVRASSSVAGLAFALASGAAAYATWVASAFWRGAAVVALLALCGLFATSTRSTAAAPDPVAA
ncbi:MULTISPECIES: hypothetical protein [unclassified Agromyces]|uniref:hypothetical protein n=1 Tax=unclassified Agromyces TaxID=2639701 RepID=UPI0030147612